MPGLRAVSAERRAAVALFALGLVAVGCGTVGYLQYWDDLSVVDALYFALGLLVVTFYPAPTGGPVPDILNVARFLGLLVASGALLAAVLAVLGNTTTRWRSRRMTEHVVVLGDGNLAVRMAVAHSRHRAGSVVLIGDADPGGKAELRRSHVRQVDALSATDLAKTAAGANLAVVVLSTDGDTLQRAMELLELPNRPRRIQAMIGDSALAHRLTWPAISRGGDLNISCVAERIAADVLTQSPPNRPDEVNGPPIVIGAGEAAAAFLRSVVNGWSLPGDPMEVWAMGPGAGSWAHPIRAEVSGWGTVHVVEEDWSPTSAGRWVQEARGAWQPVVAESQVVVDPLVVVVGLDDVEAYLVAGELASLPLSRPPIVVVERLAGWEGLLGVGPHDIVRVSTDELLTRESVTHATALDLLTRELNEYGSLWPDDMGPLFARDAEPSCEAAARALPDALRAAGLEIRAGSDRFVFLPHEVATVVAALEAAFWPDDTGLPAADARRDRLYDLLSMLPLLLARTGQRIVRTDPPTVTLDDAMIEVMAKCAHSGYVRHVETSGNATGSDVADQEWAALTAWKKEQNLSQARDVPVKVAIAGLTLAPAGVSPVDHWASLDPTLLRQLAIHEHRRWEFLHRLAGWTYGTTRNDAAKIHNCLLPWDRLEKDVKGYDESAVAQVPLLLEAVGLQAVPEVR